MLISVEIPVSEQLYLGSELHTQIPWEMLEKMHSALPVIFSSWLVYCG